jgi:hypothetical protein
MSETSRNLIVDDDPGSCRLQELARGLNIGVIF